MKILFNRPYNPFVEDSASANRYSSLIKGLLKLGVNVELIITDGLIKSNEIAINRELGTYPNLVLRYLHFYPNCKKNLRRLYVYILRRFMFIYLDKLFKKLISKDYDVLWLAYDSDVLLLFLKNKKFINKSTLIELNEYNDIFLSDLVYGNRFQYKRAKKENDIFLKAIGQIDLVAVMTSTLLSYYKNLVKSSARLLHLPMTVDFERFKLSYPFPIGFKKPYIAYIGSMADVKDGINILIDAFASIVKSYPHYHLYLVGGWHYDTPKHLNLIAKYNLTDKVFWLGELPREKIPAVLQHANLLVLPRPDSRQAQGGFPTKLGEYLASGIPVCTTSIGEIPVYLVDGVSAYFAEPGSVESFARAMDRALCDPVKAQQVGLEGKKVAEKYFNNDHQAKLLYDFIMESLMDKTE